MTEHVSWAEWITAAPLVYRLGWTLLHSLWQLAAVAALLALTRGSFAKASAHTRYLTATVALSLMFLLPVLTFPFTTATRSQAPSTPASFDPVPAPPPASGRRENEPFNRITAPALSNAPSPGAAPAPTTTLRDPIHSAAHLLESTLPWLVMLWILGVLVLSVYHLGGWIATQRLRTLGTFPVDPCLYTTLLGLAHRMALTRPVHLAQSLLVQTPLIIGSFRPLILIPASVLVGLAPAQLEAILAHELAHIRRHDYLINLLQTLVENLLFFHPAIWWVSRQIRQERENCCDDLAATLCSDRLTYAEALVSIEELRAPTALALAATGGHLLSRIQRLVTPEAPPTGHRKTTSLAAVLLTLGLFLLPLLPHQLPAKAAGPAKPIPIQSTFDPPHGTVYDPAGHPLANAQLLLYYNQNPWGLDNQIVETVTSDSAGHFTFTRPLTFERLSATTHTDHYLLFAKHPDYAIAWEVLLSHGPKPSYELFLTASQTQTFRVTDGDNHPLAGVSVGLTQASTRAATGSSIPRSFSANTDPGVVSASTDQDGQVTLANLPDTTVGFIAHKEGYGPALVLAKPLGKFPPVIKLLPSAKVAGTLLTPDGQGIANAVLAFWSADEVDYAILAKTDTQGHFAAELITKGGFPFPNHTGTGKYKVLLQHPDWTAREIPLQVAPGQVLQDLTLRAFPGILVQGRLLEPGTEHPVAGAQVEAHSPSGRLSAYTDADGRFTWRVAPGEIDVFVTAPPGGTFVVTNHRAPGERQHLVLDPSKKEIAFTLHLPSPLHLQTTLHGKILLPTGIPAAGLQIEHAFTSLESAPSSATYMGNAITAADGSFILNNAPAGQPMNLFTLTKDRRFALATQVTIPDTSPDATLPPFTLEPTHSADVLVVDAHGTPLAGTALTIQAAWGVFTVGPTSNLTTDRDGHLKTDGILSGVQYAIHDNSSFETSLTLLPKAGAPAPGPLVISDHLPLHVTDPAGKTIPIQDIRDITVKVLERNWVLGPKPEIKGHLADGSVLIDQQHVLAARCGSLITLQFKSDKGVSLTATGRFPDNHTRLELVSLTPDQPDIKPLARRADIAKDELAGTILDSVGTPIVGATISFPMYLPRHPDLIKPTTSDDQGLFRFPNFSQQRYLVMQIDKEGFARRWLVDLPLGTGFVVRLDKTTRITGDIHLPDGSPAAGATLTAVTEKIAARENMAPLGELQVSSIADAQGHFDLPLEPGTYELRLASSDHTHYARLTDLQLHAGQTLTQPVTLAPGVHLQIRTVDTLTGKPVAGAKLAIGQRFPGVVTLEPGSERTTAADGTAEWASLLPGHQEIYIQAPGYVRWGSPDSRWKFADGLGIDSVPLDLKPGMHEVLINMEPGMHLTGNVLDPRGNPVPKVFVNVFGLSTGDGRYMRPTNEQGEFDLMVPATLGHGTSRYKLVIVNPTEYYKNPQASTAEFTPQIGGEKSFTITLPTSP